jgi:hypothetical protein
MSSIRCLFDSKVKGRGQQVNDTFCLSELLQSVIESRLKLMKGVAISVGRTGTGVVEKLFSKYIG